MPRSFLTPAAMPATPPSRAARKSAVSSARVGKRERILAVAEDLFFRYGYLGTTLNMICAELEVAKPYVYYYFKDKQEIFETLCWRASVACLTALKFPAGDRRPAHLKLAEGIARFAAANVSHFRAGTFAYRDTASLRPAFHEELRRLANDFYADLCALMEAGRAEGKLSFDDAKLTALAMGGTVGFMYVWYKPAGRLPPPEMATKMAAILFRMVGLRGKPRVQPTAWPASSPHPSR